MKRASLRLATAVLLVASAQSASALTISNPFRVVSSIGSSISRIATPKPGKVRFTKAKPDAEDTGGFARPVAAAPKVVTPVAPVVQAVLPAPVVIAPSVVVGDPQSAAAVTAFEADMPVPVTAVSAVVAEQVTATGSKTDPGIASTPLPAGGLLLGFAGLALAAARRAHKV